MTALGYRELARQRSNTCWRCKKFDLLRRLLYLAGAYEVTAMATVVIREMRDRLYEDISDLAKANKLSVKEQITALLESTVSAISRGKRLANIARTIASMTPKGVVQSDSVELLREVRDR